MSKNPLPTETALEIIIEETIAVARSFGMAVATEMAQALADRLSHRLQGDQFYMPRLSTKTRKAVHQEIRERYNGKNLNDLAREYGLTPRHLRRILVDRC